MTGTDDISQDNRNSVYLVLTLSRCNNTTTCMALQVSALLNFAVRRSSGRWEKLDEARGRRRRKKRGIHDFRSLKRSPCARECLKEIFKTSSLQLRWILLGITSYHVMLYRCRSTNEETKKRRNEETKKWRSEESISLLLLFLQLLD